MPALLPSSADDDDDTARLRLFSGGTPGSAPPAEALPRAMAALGGGELMVYSSTQIVKVSDEAQSLSTLIPMQINSFFNQSTIVWLATCEIQRGSVVVAFYQGGKRMYRWYSPQLSMTSLHKTPSLLN